MGVLLVQPGSDGDYRNFEAVPPLGLVSLYSNLPEDLKRDTKLLDGQLVDTEYLIRWIEQNRPEIVGISALTFCYQTAIEIGKSANRNGAICVLGGRHATDVLPNILSRMSRGERPFDYVVSGEGELVFRKLVEDYYSGMGIQQQRNLFSSETGSVEVKSEKRSGRDEVFPALDYSILSDECSPEKYMERLGKVGMFHNVRISMPIISQRGCAYMAENNHCKFCSIPLVNPKLPIEVFEASLENLVVTTNADHVWITEGDFTANLWHMRKVLNSIRNVRSKTGNDFSIYCFARSDDLLRADVIDTLCEVGAKSVFIGYEHGDNQILKLMRKNTTKEQNLEATQRLSDKGIEVSCGGLVLGTPPETRASLEKAVSFVGELASIGNVRSVLASPIYPFPGAPYWSEFLSALDIEDISLGSSLRTADILEEEFLVEQFQRVAHHMPDGADKFSRPSIGELLAAKRMMGDLLGAGISFTENY